MSNEVLIALLSLVGTIVGSGSGILISNKLVNYRIEQLEKKLIGMQMCSLLMMKYCHNKL